jgi:hypothetical protein
VLEPVLEHVHQCSADLARRPEPPCVVAIGPDCAASPEDAVHGLRQPDREPLAAPGEARPALGFDDQVDVIGLDAELQQPEGPSGRGCKTISYDRKDVCGAE